MPGGNDMKKCPKCSRQMDKGAAKLTGYDATARYWICNEDGTVRPR